MSFLTFMQSLVGVVPAMEHAQEKQVLREASHRNRNEVTKSIAVFHMVKRMSESAAQELEDITEKQGGLLAKEKGFVKLLRGGRDDP